MELLDDADPTGEVPDSDELLQLEGWRIYVNYFISFIISAHFLRQTFRYRCCLYCLVSVPNAYTSFTVVPPVTYNWKLIVLANCVTQMSLIDEELSDIDSRYNVMADVDIRLRDALALYDTSMQQASIKYVQVFTPITVHLQIITTK